MASIEYLPLTYDVTAVSEELEQPGIWNLHRDRIERYGSPHSDVSDIWVRFNPIENIGGDPAAFFNGPHESVWYPIANKLPALRDLVYQLFADVQGSQLGGVLVTKIPPGGEVKPHTDGGWHAGYYSKFAIQIKGNHNQAFCFEDAELRAIPGEAYTFDNSLIHWVKNDSDSERVTLIVCIRL